MSEMVIDSIRVSLMNYQRVVILKEKDADRYLPIWIGPAEADAIAVRLQEVSVPRPLTHDLLRTVIATLGAGVSRIVVSDLQNDTFYAKVILQVDGKSMEVDCRPSDAIALAVRLGYFVIDPEGEKHSFDTTQEAQAYIEQLMKYNKGFDAEIRPMSPIHVEEVVLEKAGIILDKETGKPIIAGDTEEMEKPPEVKEEELKRLSAFTDFINTLDLEDLGKESQQGS